jgi:hypothetical protein
MCGMVHVQPPLILVYIYIHCLSATCICSVRQTPPCYAESDKTVTGQRGTVHVVFAQWAVLAVTHSNR